MFFAGNIHRLPVNDINSIAKLTQISEKVICQKIP